MTDFLSRQERDDFREDVQHFIDGNVCSASFRKVLKLLKHIDALERQVEENKKDALRYRAIRIGVTMPESPEAALFMSFEELAENRPDLLDADLDKVIAALAGAEGEKI